MLSAAAATSVAVLSSPRVLLLDSVVLAHICTRVAREPPRPAAGLARSEPQARSGAEQKSSMSSKRGAGSDLNRDNWEAQMDNEGPTEMGTWQKADEVQRTLPCSTPPDVPC